MDKRHKGFNTRAIHPEKSAGNPSNALRVPIFMTSTFSFDSVEQAERAMEFVSADYVYTRGNNPTLRELEECVSELEGGRGGVAFSSGMAAVTSVLMSLSQSGSSIVASRTLYGGTYSFMTRTLPLYGVRVVLVDMSDEDAIINAIDGSTACVFLETPCNPSVSLLDIGRISEISKKANGDVKVVVDNTFATPYNQRPIELGADIVVHSATKYLSGHGDVIGGIAVSSDEEYIHRLKFDFMCEFGGALSPFNAYLILRGIKTLGIRMEKHSSNAMAVASHLHMSEKVSSVHYPGLKSSPWYGLCMRQMKTAGGMVSFELHGGVEAARRFLDSLSMIKIAVSLGDVETLAEIPALMTHRGYDSPDSEGWGFTEGTIRISVGIEDVQDIIDDIDRALESV